MEVDLELMIKKEGRIIESEIVIGEGRRIWIKRI